MLFGLFGTGETDWSSSWQIGKIASRISHYLKPCVAGQSPWDFDINLYGADLAEIARSPERALALVEGVSLSGPVSVFVTHTALYVVGELSDGKIEVKNAMVSVGVVMQSLFDLPREEIYAVGESLTWQRKALLDAAREYDDPDAAIANLPGLLALQAGEDAARAFVARHRETPKARFRASPEIVEHARAAFATEDQLARARAAAFADAVD